MLLLRFLGEINRETQSTEHHCSACAARNVDMTPVEHSAVDLQHKYILPLLTHFKPHAESISSHSEGSLTSPTAITCELIPTRPDDAFLLGGPIQQTLESSINRELMEESNSEPEPMSRNPKEAGERGYLIPPIDLTEYSDNDDDSMF